MSNYTEAKRKANAKWDKENIARLSVAMSKEEQAETRAAAARAGESVNAYIKQAIRERMEREGKP